MKKQIKFTIKNQLILLLSVTLGLSLISYISIGTSLVVRDKESYIYDQSVSQVHATAQSIESKVRGAKAVVRSAVAVIAAQSSANQISFLKRALLQQSKDLGLDSFTLFELNRVDRKITVSQHFSAVPVQEKETALLPDLLNQALTRSGHGSESWQSEAVQFDGKGGLSWFEEFGKNAQGDLIYAWVNLKLADQGATNGSKEVSVLVVDQNDTYLNYGLDFKRGILNQSGSGNQRVVPTTEIQELKALFKSTSFNSGVTDHSLGQGSGKTDLIVGYKKIPQLGLIVLSLVSKETAYSAAKVLVQRSTLLGLSILLIAVGVSLFAVRGLTARLRDLWQATQRIAQGDYSSRVRTSGPLLDEVTDLSTSFNSMSEDITLARAQLEDYAKNLEQKVKERTAELNYANQLLSAILNSLGQGFFIFDQQKKCLPVFSKACTDLLETAPAGKSIEEVMRVPEGEKELFNEWCDSIFANLLPFEDMVGLGPKSFGHSKGKKVEIEYHPMMKDQSENLEGVVVVATDRTREHEARLQAQRERDYAKRIIKLAKDKELFVGFVEATNQLFQEIHAELEREQPEIEAILRGLHTVKGSAANFGIESMVATAHELETQTISSRDNPAELSGTLGRLKDVGLRTLSKQLRDFFEENKEIIGRSYDETERHIDFAVSSLISFAEQLKQMSSIQEIRKRFVQEFLHEPLLKYLKHFDEVVSTNAKKLGKEVSPIQFTLGSITVLGEVYQELFTSLVHSFRNSIDHGIESPEERLRAGKPTTGKIEVHAKVVSGTLILLIRDDGKGISADVIRRKLISQGRKLEAETESDEQVIQHVFDNGLSTKENVSELSGRGVGMDAILTEAKRLGGSAKVSTQVGKGTELRIEVPYIEDMDQAKVWLHSRNKKGLKSLAA